MTAIPVKAGIRMDLTAIRVCAGIPLQVLTLNGTLEIPPPVFPGTNSHHILEDKVEMCIAVEPRLARDDDVVGLAVRSEQILRLGNTVSVDEGGESLLLKTVEIFRQLVCRAADR